MTNTTAMDPMDQDVRRRLAQRLTAGGDTSPSSFMPGEPNGPQTPPPPPPANPQQPPGPPPPSGPVSPPAPQHPPGWPYETPPGQTPVHVPVPGQDTPPPPVQPAPPPLPTPTSDGPMVAPGVSPYPTGPFQHGQIGMPMQPPGMPEGGPVMQPQFMQFPDGRTMRVPAHHVGHYRARGARVINGGY